MSPLRRFRLCFFNFRLDLSFSLCFDCSFSFLDLEDELSDLIEAEDAALLSSDSEGWLLNVALPT